MLLRRRWQDVRRCAVPNRAAPLHAREDEYVRTCPHNLHESWCPYNATASASRTLSHHFRCAVGHVWPNAGVRSFTRTRTTRRRPRRLHVHLPLARLNACPTIFRFSSEWIYIVHPDASGIGVHRLDTGLLRAHTICRRLYRPGRGKSHFHGWLHSTIFVLTGFSADGKIGRAHV